MDQDSKMSSHIPRSVFKGTIRTNTNISLRQFALEFIKHDVLFNISCRNDYHARQRAYFKMANALEERPMGVIMYVPQFRKTFYDWMLRIARLGNPRAGLKRTPRWVQKVEEKLKMLPRAIEEVSLLEPGRSKGKAQTPSGVLKLFVSHGLRHRSLCSSALYHDLRRVLRCPRAVIDLHALWVRAQRVCMREVLARCRAGDAPEHKLGSATWQVADLVLLYTDLDAQQLLTEESAVSGAERDALLLLLALVRRHAAERTAAPTAWTAVYRDYIATGRMTSLVVLQRRWHELKLQARDRILACWRADAGPQPEGPPAPGPPPPALLHVLLVQSFPHVVTEPVASWSRLVADSRVLMAPLNDKATCDKSGVEETATSDYSDAEDAEDAVASDHIEDNKAKPPDIPAMDDPDEDVQLIEKPIDTVDVDSGSDAEDKLVIDEPARKRAKTDTIKSEISVSYDVPIVGTETKPDVDTIDNCNVNSGELNPIENKPFKINVATVGSINNRLNPDAVEYRMDTLDKQEKVLDKADDDIPSTNDDIKEMDTNQTLDILESLDPVRLKAKIVFESDSDDDMLENKQSDDVDASNDSQPVGNIISRLVFTDDESDAASETSGNIHIPALADAVARDIKVDFGSPKDYGATHEDECTVDQKLVMEARVHLLRLHDTAQWKKYNRKNKYINIDRIQTDTSTGIYVDTQQDVDQFKHNKESVGTVNEFLNQNISDVRSRKRSAASNMFKLPPHLGKMFHEGGSRDNDRVAKKVQLPDIEEVRRVNSNILTAQVSPITATGEPKSPGNKSVQGEPEGLPSLEEGLPSELELQPILQRLLGELNQRELGRCCDDPLQCTHNTRTREEARACVRQRHQLERDVADLRRQLRALLPQPDKKDKECPPKKIKNTKTSKRKQPNHKNSEPKQAEEWEVLLTEENSSAARELAEWERQKTMHTKFFHINTSNNRKRKSAASERDGNDQPSRTTPEPTTQTNYAATVELEVPATESASQPPLIVSPMSAAEATAEWERQKTMHRSYVIITNLGNKSRFTVTGARPHSTKTEEIRKNIMSMINTRIVNTSTLNPMNIVDMRAPQASFKKIVKLQKPPDFVVNPIGTPKSAGTPIPKPVSIPATRVAARTDAVQGAVEGDQPDHINCDSEPHLIKLHFPVSASTITDDQVAADAGSDVTELPRLSTTQRISDISSDNLGDNCKAIDVIGNNNATENNLNEGCKSDDDVVLIKDQDDPIVIDDDDSNDAVVGMSVVEGNTNIGHVDEPNGDTTCLVESNTVTAANVTEGNDITSLQPTPNATMCVDIISLTGADCVGGDKTNKVDDLSTSRIVTLVRGFGNNGIVKNVISNPNETIPPITQYIDLSTDDDDEVTVVGDSVNTEHNSPIFPIIVSSESITEPTELTASENHSKVDQLGRGKPLPVHKVTVNPSKVNLESTLVDASGRLGKHESNQVYELTADTACVSLEPSQVGASGKCSRVIELGAGKATPVHEVNVDVDNLHKPSEVISTGSKIADLATDDPLAVHEDIVDSGSMQKLNEVTAYGSELAELRTDDALAVHEDAVGSGSMQKPNEVTAYGNELAELGTDDALAGNNANVDVDNLNKPSEVTTSGSKIAELGTVDASAVPNVSEDSDSMQKPSVVTAFGNETVGIKRTALMLVDEVTLASTHSFEPRDVTATGNCYGVVEPDKDESMPVPEINVDGDSMEELNKDTASVSEITESVSDVVKLNREVNVDLGSLEPNEASAFDNCSAMPIRVDPGGIKEASDVTAAGSETNELGRGEAKLEHEVIVDIGSKNLEPNVICTSVIGSKEVKSGKSETTPVHIVPVDPEIVEKSNEVTASNNSSLLN